MTVEGGPVRQQAELHLEEVAEALYRLASLDFTSRYAIRGDGSVIDAVAGCINMLSEELAAHLDERSRIERELEDRVRARTVELSDRNADLRLLLDNVEQGFFTIDRSGAMSPEHSAVLGAWFGPVEPGERIDRYFGRHDAAFGAELEVAWQQVVDDILPVELTLDQMPKRLMCGARHYRFSYVPIGGGGSPRFLVVVSDETRTVAHESQQSEKKEILSLFEHILADRAGVIAFMDEASGIVSRILLPRADDRVELKRDLHTLKGNAAVFGLQSVVEICHELESHMAREGALPEEAVAASLHERWSRLSEQVDRLLGEGRDVIEMSPRQHGELERAVRGGAARDDLLRLVQELRLEPVERRLRHIAEQASQMGLRIGKEISVSVSHGGLRLDAQHWSKVWQAFVHAVRNAVDHGIEPAEERAGAAKPGAGHVELRAMRDGTNVVIEIEDDGRGIRWDRLRDRVVARGLPASTRQDLVAALLAGGVSTAREITEISGRGLGLAALGSAVQALGGQIEIEGEPGRGTLLRMRFPEAAVAPQWSSR
jgi:two-component system chemotaxis sensor kinase CheA